MQLFKWAAIMALALGILGLPELIASLIPAEWSWVIFDLFAVGIIVIICKLVLWATRDWDN